MVAQLRISRTKPTFPVSDKDFYHSMSRHRNDQSEGPEPPVPAINVYVCISLEALVSTPTRTIQALSRALSVNLWPYPKACSRDPSWMPVEDPVLKSVGCSRRPREPPWEGRQMNAQQDSMLPQLVWLSSGGILSMWIEERKLAKAALTSEHLCHHSNKCV